jgi:molecular chaperone GrpE
MSDHAPPLVPGDAALDHRQEALTPGRIENLLAEFRAWLEQAAAAPAAPETPVPAPAVDLHTLLSQFVALRHEVNLQTRASRAQQEQSAAALREMGQALELLERREASLGQTEEQRRDEQLRPVLKALLDVHDALALARREVLRGQDVMGEVLDKLDSPAEVVEERPLPALSPAVPAPPPQPSFWGKLLGKKPEPGPRFEPPADQREAIELWKQRVAQQREQLLALRQERAEIRNAAGHVRRFVDSIVTGYTMSLQRLERALQQQGLEPIPTVGQPFDPEAMEVVEVVPGPGRTSAEVIDEVRRGYRWRGRVFRFAQVRVAKP